jgi:hypothetical protein
MRGVDKMKKKSRILFLFMLVLLMTAATAPAETIWETFDTNPSARGWSVETVGDTVSTITYNSGGYIDAKLARDIPAYVRYHKHLSTAYDQTQEFWFEYDFQLLGTGTITGDRRGQFGVFNSENSCNANAVVDSFAYWSYLDNLGNRGNRHDMYGWSPTSVARPSPTSLGNANYDASGTLLANGPEGPLQNRLPYDSIFRVKAHYYYSGGVGRCSLKIYNIDMVTGAIIDMNSLTNPDSDCNTQTNPAADPCAVFAGETLDVNIFGISSRVEGNFSTDYALIRLDNFYFSTTGANGTVVRANFPDLTVNINEVRATTTTTSLDVNTTISHTRSTSMTYRIRQRVYKGADGSGGEITAYAMTSGSISVPANTLVSARLTNASLSPTPTPWSVSDPNCYMLRTEVLDSTGAVALLSKTSIIGFRKFEVAGQNFKLNGNRIYLFGLHRTPPGRILAGIYNNQSFIDQHIARLKTANVNMVRIADANATAWLDACDKAGIMVFCGPYDTNNVLIENKAKLLDYVSKVNTHPCVVAWVTGNEWSTSVVGDRTALYNYIKSLDPNRPVFLADSAGFYTSGDPATSTGSNFLDHHKYNGWYSGSAFDFTSFATTEASKSYPVTLTECVGAYTDYASTGGFTLGQDTDATHLDKYIGAVERVIGHSYNYAQDSLAYQTFLAKEVAETLRRSRSTTSAISGATLFTEAYFYDMDQYYYHNEPNKTESAKPIIAAITSAYEPVHVSIECVNPNVFAGTSISATMHILNDNIVKNPLGATTLRVKLLDSANVVKSTNTYSIGSIAYYAKATQAVSIATAGLATGNYTIVAEVNELVPILSQNTMPVFIAAAGFKTCANTGGTSVLAVYDPGGATRTALTAAGVTYTQITVFSGLSGYSRLIIGKDSFDATVKAADATIKTWLNAGKRMLILEQNSAGRTDFSSSWLGKTISLGGSSEDFTNIERPQLATLMNGLNRMNDFRNWNDAGTGARSVYDSYVGITALDPNVAVLANGGLHLDDATLVEVWPDGGGSCIISTLNGVTKVTDPKAARCLANIVGYLLESATHYQYDDVAYKITFGDFATEKGVFSMPLLQGMIVADSGAAHYQPDGRAFRGPQISDAIGNLTAASSADFICPLYIRANFKFGGTGDANAISVDVSSPNDVAPTLSYRLKVNGTATGYVSLAANERKTSNFTVASITAGTNVKLEIDSGKGLVFHSMRLGNASPGDINEDGIVNFIDFAMLAENWLKTDFWSPQ